MGWCSVEKTRIIKKIVALCNCRIFSALISNDTCYPKIFLFLLLVMLHLYSPFIIISRSQQVKFLKFYPFYHFLEATSAYAAINFSFYIDSLYHLLHYFHSKHIFAMIKFAVKYSKSSLGSQIKGIARSYIYIHHIYISYIDICVWISLGPTLYLEPKMNRMFITRCYDTFMINFQCQAWWR